MSVACFYGNVIIGSRHAAGVNLLTRLLGCVKMGGVVSMNTPDGLGLDSVLHSPDGRSWPGEKIPSVPNLAPMRRAWEDLLAERADEAFGRLTSFTEAVFRDTPSFLMRWYYYLALTHVQLAERASGAESRKEYLLARDAYKSALSLAVGGADAASQVILHRMLGETYHNLFQYDQGLSEYLTALSALRRYKPGSEKECAGAEISLYSRIARQQFLLGQNAAALDNIRAARELRARYGGPLMTQWDRAVEEWLEALISRAESQRCGGDMKLLRSALHLFKSAEKRLMGDEEHVSSQRRLYIQLAETHLDLAERYRSEGKHVSFKGNMRQAEKYGFMASDALRDSQDDAGRVLTTLTLLRHDHLSLKAYELAPLIHDMETSGDPVDLHAHALAPRIYDLEQKAADSNDFVLIARAATLRADVLASMRDYTAALTVYYFAIATFERAGARGESARAVYGVRKVLDLV